MSILLPGVNIGDRYVVQREIGRGGMQEVYSAYDSTLNKSVALKVPQDARVARKFRSSAVLAAKVNHPNVAKTLDYLEEDGLFYLVEEHVDGLDLKRVMSQFQRLDPHTCAHILHHLARGVAASHRAGVVHRDLKPSNIMVAGGLQFGGLKITDFGIARMAEHEMEEAASGGEETTAKSRTMMNALAYVAPEVVDASSRPSMPADVWAIAAIVWELLTGIAPFGTGLRALKQIFAGTLPTLPAVIANHVQFGPLATQLSEILLPCFDQLPTSRPTANRLVEICNQLPYLPPDRETGVVENYPVSTYGFIVADRGDQVFFHVQSVVGDGSRPPIGTRVWFTRFEGQPRPRAIPVVPLKAQA